MFNADKFVKEVREMRRHQKDFFRTKSQDSLRYAKNMEKKVDEGLKLYEEFQKTKGQKSLF